MKKKYMEVPENFSEIVPYVVTQKQDIIKAIILAEKCYFYDTCAFRNHIVVPTPELIFEYVKKAGVVVLTRTIIMELCSNDGRLWQEHIDYIKKMYEYGIIVIVMYEEDCMEILKECYDSVPKINEKLSYAVKCSKSKAGTVEETLEKERELKKGLLIEPYKETGTLADKFFQKVRANKKTGDSLGEELIAICIHWLSNIRELGEYKYNVFTDDKKAMPMFGKVRSNVEQYIGKRSMAVITTAKLCMLLKEKGIIENEEQITNMLKAVGAENRMNIYCSEEFEMAPMEKSLSVEEYAKKLMTGKIEVVYF